MEKTHNMKQEMVEGTKAKENFEHTMKSLFRVPKDEVVKAEKKHMARRRKKKS